MLYNIKNLKKKYEGRTVLDLERLEFEDRKITGLLGPNGAGKTTLLEILAFILEPTSGEVAFNDDKIDFRAPGLIQKRRRVVLLQQNPVLFSTSVFNNVAFPMKIRKGDKKEIKAKVLGLLKMVGMEGFLNAGGRTLSGGETQRVAIAQALACFPEVILMDEPTSSADVENRAAIEKIIGDINREKGISVIFTTHDMLQASRISDNTVYINNGMPASSVHENLFTCNIVQTGNGAYFKISDKAGLYRKSERSGPARISIDPAKIRIISGKDRGNENVISGRIIQITDETGRIRILVRGDIPLVFYMNKNDYNQIRPGAGENILVECPPESIRII